MAKSGYPTTITIEPNSGYPGQDIRITWSQATRPSSGSIVGYRIYYRECPHPYEGGSFSTYQRVSSNNSTSGSLIFRIPTTVTLDYLEFRIQTLASNSNDNSDLSPYTGNVYCRITEEPLIKPDAPRYIGDTQGIGNTYINISCSIKATRCYYAYNANMIGEQQLGGDGNYNSWRTVSSSRLLDSSGNFSIYFQCENETSDGRTIRSNVSSTYITILDYSPPAPTSVQLVYDQIEGIEGTVNVPLGAPKALQFTVDTGTDIDQEPNSLSIIAQVSNSYSNLTNNLGTNITLDTQNFIFYRDGRTYNISINNNTINNNYKGYYVRYGISFKNNYGTSTITFDRNSIIQIPTQINSVNITKIINNPGGEENSLLDPSYFGNGIYISWTNPSATSGNPNIQSTEVIYQTSSNKTSWSNSYRTGIYGPTGFGVIAGAENNPVGISVVSNFTPGYYYRFGVRLTDAQGYFTDTISTNSSHVLYRGYGPELSTDVFSITGPEEDNMVTIRPYTNTQNIVFSSVKAISDNPVVYYISAFIEDRGLTIPILNGVEPDASSSGDTVTFTVQAADINSILKNNSLKDNPQDTVWNTNFSNVRYRIYAMDGLGMTSTINSSNNTQIKFIEAPSFNIGEYINLGVQYGENSSLDKNRVQMASTSTNGDLNIANERMFNPGEAVFLNFNKANDYNEDIIGYRLFVKRLDTKPAIAFDANYSTGNFEILKTYSLEELNIDNNEINMIYPINSYNINKFLIFAVAAIDGKGNLSAYKYSETYLVGCRVQTATINYTSQLDNSTKKLNFSYLISDLGGSKFINDTVYTYEQYPNFERAISLSDQNYIKKARISLEYCLDGNFNNTSSENYGVTTIDYDSNTDFKSIASNNGQYVTISTDTLNEIFLNKKLYSRITLIFSTGLGNSNISGFENLSVIITHSPIRTYYVNMPTISHRANHIGINTNIFSEANDEILVLSDFSERGKIRITGTNESGEEMNIIINMKDGIIIGYDTSGAETITIDLKNKIIDGATISGGSW